MRPSRNCNRPLIWRRDPRNAATISDAPLQQPAVSPTLSRSLNPPQRSPAAKSPHPADAGGHVLRDREVPASHTTARQALELAEKQQNNELATALRGNIALYEHQTVSGSSPNVPRSPSYRLSSRDLTALSFDLPRSHAQSSRRTRRRLVSAANSGVSQGIFLVVTGGSTSENWTPDGASFHLRPSRDRSPFQV